VGNKYLKFLSSFPASGFPTWPPIPSIPFSAPPVGGGLLFGGGWLPLPPAASLPNSIIPDQRRQPPTIGARLKRANGRAGADRNELILLLLLLPFFALRSSAAAGAADHNHGPAGSRRRRKTRRTADLVIGS
jgi:hypothetical protein